jgi:pyridoxine 4-dehydrogenase
MLSPDATLAGTFAIGGDLVVHRLGFGAMRITGPDIWGPPLDVEEARRTIRRLPELGIDFVDTAEAYGPYISESCWPGNSRPMARSSSRPRAEIRGKDPRSGRRSVVPSSSSRASRHR